MRKMIGAPRADRSVDGELIRDVRVGLGRRPRQIPSRYLYDDLGSALFAAICQLPWYRVTRAESRLLTEHARDICRLADPVTRLVELGPGSGEKLETLIDVGRPSASSLEIHLVDVSSSALDEASRRLATRERVRTVTHEAPYEIGLRAAASGSGRAGRTLALFLGSNIGNFDRVEAGRLLGQLRQALGAKGALLVGTDLVKPARDLLDAYDDPLGVTAAFNKNLLCRLNRELGADFDLTRFAHRAVWNAPEARVEMHLVSLAEQRVHVAQAGLTFTLSKDETIWTESSYKFEPADVMARLETAGFQPVKQWIDADAGFALTLARAAAP